ncbi:MAG: hypothetical protein ACR2MT_06245 [Aurantibacter sp.]
MMPTSSRFFLFLILCVGCATSDSQVTIAVSETAGLDREIEYISTTIRFERQPEVNDMLFAKDLENDSSAPVQVLEAIRNEGGVHCDILFPVAISANQTKKFEISIEEKMRDALPVQLMLSEDKLSVENRYYKAHFSAENDQRGGQVNGIILKDFEDQILRRGHIAMHWAPNFSKSDSESYFNMEDLPSSSEHSVKREVYRVVKERLGIADSVPEIYVEGRYEFYADLPYFLFESTMTMHEDVELDLLRNDEMTMDSLFTHVIYPKREGSVGHLRLYGRELDILDDNPITDDANWVAFYNEDRDYGFASIRLKYDNSNLKGSASPTYRPYTKISRASGNGRYWNRVLSDTIQTFPKGSRYHEKNAYLIFRTDIKLPEKELLYYAERLINPLKVVVGQNH